jgi:predicted LPLAT superfamily acyltransferase
VTYAAVIPTLNHYKKLPDIIADIRAIGLEVVIIDDGSDTTAGQKIASLATDDGAVTVLRHARNQGKGAAVLEGFRAVFAKGHSHAIQIDADGQHDLNALAGMIALSRDNPDALIIGVPDYDQSIPLSRRIGRWVTHVWVWIETLSLALSDTMCGFRVYPLAATIDLMDQQCIGKGMDFDTDIAVKLVWRGVPVVESAVAVTYPPNSHSNFRVFQDNLLISWMHTRLFFTMLATLPSVLKNRPKVIKPTRHWSVLSERGVYTGLYFLTAVVKLLGRRACRYALYPIITYFWLTGRESRQASFDYLGRVLERAPTWRDGLKHFFSFGDKTVEAFAAWIGLSPIARLEFEAAPNLHKLEAEPGGLLLIVSHFGNIELLRAGLSPALRARLTAFVHSDNAVQFNRVLARFQPNAALNTIQVTDVGPDTMLDLKQRVDNGEWIAIAGDRTPVNVAGPGRDRVANVPFLGAPAPFPQGPYIIAALLGCPVYTMFCLPGSQPQSHRVVFEKFADKIVLPKGRGKDAVIIEHAARYADRLAGLCRKQPYLWYNFFNFWEQA